MVRDSPSPGPRVAASPGTKRRTPRAKSIKRLLASNLSPFQVTLTNGSTLSGHVTTCSPVIGCQERLKETEFYTKPIIDKFDQTKSVKVRAHAAVDLCMNFANAKLY